MKDDLTATNGTAPENGAGATAPGKTQEKASKPDWRSSGAGKGVWRAIIDTFIIAAGFSLLVFLYSVWEYMNSPEPHELSSEVVLNMLIGMIIIFIGVLQYVGPFVLLAGAILGSKGVFDEKKKRPPEPPSSEPGP